MAGPVCSVQEWGVVPSALSRSGECRVCTSPSCEEGRAELQARGWVGAWMDIPKGGGPLAGFQDSPRERQNHMKWAYEKKRGIYGRP